MRRTYVFSTGIAVLTLSFGAMVAALGEPPPNAARTLDPVVAEVHAIVPLTDDSYVEVSVLVDTRRANPDDIIQELAPDRVTDAGVIASYGLWRKWAPQDIPVSVRYNPEWDPLFLSGRAALQWSIGQWNSVSGSTFRFAEGPDTSAYATGTLCNYQIDDDINSVRFSYILPLGTLGLTCAIVGGVQSGIPRVVEFDLQLDGTTDWTDSPTTPYWAYDLRSVMLHELGHALGLDHTSSTGAVMLPTIGPGVQMRTLTSDDRAGVLALYGAAAPTPTPSTPTLSLTSPRFCRTSPTCAGGAEPLYVGQQARAAFGVTPNPQQQLRADVRWNGVAKTTAIWSAPPYQPGGLFYLADDILGIPSTTGNFELQVWAGTVFVGSFSAPVSAAQTTPTKTPTTTATKTPTGGTAPTHIQNLTAGFNLVGGPLQTDMPPGDFMSCLPTGSWNAVYVWDASKQKWKRYFRPGTVPGYVNDPAAGGIQTIARLSGVVVFTAGAVPNARFKDGAGSC